MKTGIPGNNNNNNNNNNLISLLTYSKQIAIFKLKVKKGTIKTYLQFISIKKNIFKHNNNNNNGKTKVIKLQ